MISCIPINLAKIFLYNTILGYDIDYSSSIGLFNIINGVKVKMTSAKIGMFNFIKVENLIMDNGSNINKLNRIKNLNILRLGERSRIYDKNFIGGGPKELKENGFVFTEQNVTLGKDSAVNRNNYFDVVRAIKIGDNVVFGGVETQIWTHGFHIDRTMLVGEVEFGCNIFIGSRSMFTKGVKITDDVTVGPASVIYKSITEKGVYSTHKIEKVK